MTTRSGIFNSIRGSLVSASLTASDLSSSSIPVSIRGEFNNNKSNASLLPVVTVSKAEMPSVGTPFFNSDLAFDSFREVHVLIDIFAKKNTHIDQLASQIDNYFSTYGVSGLSIVGFDEDDELQSPNSNLAHHKSLMYTFKVRQ